jgi:N-dimethylarginine dimethylaminohydrolase
MTNVNVTHEWAELKEVIIGRPLAETDRIWTWTPGMDEELTHVKPETFDWLKSNAGKTWKEANPELFQKINDQVENYAATLEKRGVKVHRPPHVEHGDADYINAGIEQVWPRDVFCTAGNTVIVSSLRLPWKRKQQFTFLPLYAPKMAAGECRFISAPQASTDILSPRQHQAEEYCILLDGGDFLVNGNEIYLGIGHGSNMLGAKFAQDVLGEEYTIYPLELSTNSLHLDCTMSLLRPGLGLLCREWLKSELPPGLRDFEWIEVTPEEASWLGTNGLPLNPETYIADKRHGRVIKEIESRGHEVIAIPYDGPSYMGGSLRCSSQPLVRVG